MYLFLQLLFQSTLPTRGSDPSLAGARCAIPHFNPRSPRGGATVLISSNRFKSFISIHAPHEGERLKLINDLSDQICISIHAPHEGERHIAGQARGNFVDISIHAPHEGERRALHFVTSAIALNFNPRSPRGGATIARLPPLGMAYNFNPRSPRGGATRSACKSKPRYKHISIHAPHEGERPPLSCLSGLHIEISIHAPHEGERHQTTTYRLFHHINFNPRSPRGGATW